MKAFLSITKALSDETRVRALMALTGGELCVCQLIELLGLAPSTVSKHLSILTDAGLVAKRKEGRWHYFRLTGPDAPPLVRQALAWTIEALAEDLAVQADTGRLCQVRKSDLEELCACYRS